MAALNSDPWRYFVAIDELRRGQVNPIDEVAPRGPDRVTQGNARIVIDDADDEYDVTLVNAGAAVPPIGRWGGQLHDAMDGSATDVAWVYTDAAARSDPTNYLYFGCWVRHDPGDLRFTADALSGAVGATVGAPVDVGGVGGTATCSGAAAGNYALNAPLCGPVESGPWVADGTLSADFDTGGVSGRIGSFVAGTGPNPRSWTIELPAVGLSGPGRETVGRPGGVNPVWSIGAERDRGRGAWLAQFHEVGPDGGAPLSATRRFTAAFQNWAAMSGAFGVHRQYRMSASPFQDRRPTGGRVFLPPARPRAALAGWSSPLRVAGRPGPAAAARPSEGPGAGKGANSLPGPSARQGEDSRPIVRSEHRTNHRRTTVNSPKPLRETCRRFDLPDVGEAADSDTCRLTLRAP